LSALFVAVTVIAGLVGGLSVDEIISTFTKGAAGITGGNLILGISYGISWLLSEANILDTIVYYLSRPLSGLPSMVSIFGILVAIMLINLFIPSGSGKAAIVMPIVLPIADIMGITAQTAVLAYQFGDGLTNMCTPLLGVLVLALGFGKVPFSKWERFILPLVGILTIIACIFLFIATQIGYA
ncbi:MAG: TIGR00366 family protein, partial [Lachnospiraceae bacterium]|nr:TIGR00366 family protein [Lachnospiraceae bacterium]